MEATIFYRNVGIEVAWALTVNSSGIYYTARFIAVLSFTDEVAPKPTVQRSSDMADINIKNEVS